MWLFSDNFFSLNAAGSAHSEKGNQSHDFLKTKMSYPKFTVNAVTKGSAESSKSEETVPSWAKPCSEEPHPWAQGEGKKAALENGFEVPFFVYLLASVVKAMISLSFHWSHLQMHTIGQVITSLNHMA